MAGERRKTPQRDELTDKWLSAFPKLTQVEQTVSIQIFRLLVGGKPVSPIALADSLGWTTDRVHKVLEKRCGISRDEKGRIVAYGGLSLSETDHRFVVNGRNLYTWCALDSLLIPQLITRAARVESRCPMTNQKIRLTVSPGRIKKVEPSGITVSLLKPDLIEPGGNCLQNVCPWIRFFSSEAAGARWVANNARTILLSLEGAFNLAQVEVTTRYKDVL